MSELIDISLGIGPDMLVWPGDPAVEIVRRLQIAKGDPANVSELHIGTHTGTHVDPPVHFIEGAEGIAGVSPEILTGPVVVAHLPDARTPLGPAELDTLDLPPGTARLVLRTSNSELWRLPRPIPFPDTYACLSPEGARWIIRRGIRLIGVDFLSIEERGASTHPVHKELLRNGVVIVEGLDLGAVQAGQYQLMCLPLRVIDGDGGPARAFLVRE